MFTVQSNIHHSFHVSSLIFELVKAMMNILLSELVITTRNNNNISRNNNDIDSANANGKKTLTSITTTTPQTKRSTTTMYPVSASSPGQASLTTPHTASCTAESRKASPPCMHIIRNKSFSWKSLEEHYCL